MMQIANLSPSKNLSEISLHFIILTNKFITFRTIWLEFFSPIPSIWNYLIEDIK